jgi:curved DNA-binding protein CbpA
MTMKPDERQTDYYEVLQISPNAEPDTVHRVYRLLAQRFHPDNQETGNANRFRLLHEAYSVLSDAQQRAHYDLQYQQLRQERIRLVSVANRTENDFELEQSVRLTVLEALYTQRRIYPNTPGIFDLDLEEVTGTSREHLEFTFWYLMARNMVKRGEHSRLIITAEGVDYLEQNLKTGLQLRRLPEHRHSA